MTIAFIVFLIVLPMLCDSKKREFDNKRRFFERYGAEKPFDGK